MPRRRVPKKTTPDGKIVLEPQPDDSPNDPLNWPLWRRNMALVAIGLICTLGGGLTPVISAGFEDIAEAFHVPVPKVALTTGFFMMGLGLGGVVASPTAVLFGKRFVFLVGATLMIATSIWCAISPSFGSLVAARIFEGMATSPVEVLPSAAITELFFLHQRAFRLGLYTLLLLTGKNLAPLLGAVINEKSGWRTVFWVVTAYATACLVLLFLFMGETYWDRRPRQIEVAKDMQRRSRTVSDLNVIEESTSNLAPSRNGGFHGVVEAYDQPGWVTNESKTHVEEVETTILSTWTNINDPIPIENQDYTERLRSHPRRTFIQTLSPFTGRINQDSWLKVALRPFILFSYPAILWSSLVYSLSIGWLIVLSEAVGQIYENKETYHFTSLETGMVFLSPFIGAVLGSALAGKISDTIVQILSKRNDGVYEPEFRLAMIPAVALATSAGLYGFGWSVEVRDNPIVPTIFFGIISFGCALGSTTAITYCVDSYRQYAGEALVTLNFSKNIFHGLVFSLFFPQWLQRSGSKKVFIALGTIQMVCMAASIPMYIYGKRARFWTSQRSVMARF
ncbi:MFS general substrate transporter [Microthyrium microscopicum]|uniref:MFS general substrate transporter n=1 Tax=Microthyrium microscopicum TaxID=703497 RepID=A0A6A6UDR4_9PEZI|nr:MFS general substrate transporter [Microthyrium microscopicum]